MSNITLDGQHFSYTINRRSQSSISLRLRSRRSFVINCHHLTPNLLITDFITSHRQWILKNSQKLSAKKSLRTLKNLQILDRSYELIIKESQMDSVVIFKEEQKIYANSTSLSRHHLKSLLDSKFRPFALSLITEEIKKLSSNFEFKYGRITVKNTTSRFGSCSTQNNLNFNWQIILLPYPIFRHILLHELTHTIHHNHSRLFWNQLEKYDHSWRANRHYLRTRASKHFIL
jgi:predicted metal-dependent hydrolase